MMDSLGHEPLPAGVAALLRGLVDALVIDEQDAELTTRVEAHGMRAVVVDTDHARPGGAGASGAGGAGRGWDSGVTIEIVPVNVAGEIEAGDDLAGLLLAGAPALVAGDVMVVSHKAVSKSEGRMADLREVTPSPRAIELAGPESDPRLAEMVLRESRRIVRRRGSLLIAETHHGFVCASARHRSLELARGRTSVVLPPVDPTPRRRGCGPSWSGVAGRLASRWWWPTPWAGRCETGSWVRPSASAGSSRCGGTRARTTRRATRCGRRRWPWPTSWRCGRPGAGEAGAGAGGARARVRRYRRRQRAELVRPAERDLFI